MTSIKSDKGAEDVKEDLKNVTTEESKLEEHINLRVCNQDGGVVYFKIKRNTPLKKLMQTFCKRTGLCMDNVRFRFDGEAIHTNDTPAKLQMENDDAIEVFQQQFGGYSTAGLVCWCSDLSFTK